MDSGTGRCFAPSGGDKVDDSAQRPRRNTMISAEETPTRVLVVDDEVDLQLLVRQKFRRRIRNRELDFLFAHNGKEALDILGQNPDVQLVLSDINMPVMDGLTMLSQLSKMDSDVQAVVVSAYGDMGNIRTAMNRGAFDFLTKPIDFNDLEITIDKGIRQVHIQRAALAARDRLVTINRELELASEVQMSARPRDMPSTENHQVHAVIIPAREVGGDFYDYFPINDTNMGLCIADVSGKGVPAALFTMVTRALLRAAVKDFESPADCLDLVNDLLCEDNESCIFITLFFAVIDFRNGRLNFANAGHNPPLLLRANSQVESLESTGNLVLGIQPRHGYLNGNVQLGIGDTLFLYTDGITEAENSRQEQFEEARLYQRLEAFAGNSATEVAQGMVDAVREFTGGAPQSDDITCLAMQLLGYAGEMQ